MLTRQVEVSEVCRRSVENPSCDPSDGLLVRDAGSEEREDGSVRRSSDSSCFWVREELEGQRLRRSRLKKKKKLAVSPRTKAIVDDVREVVEVPPRDRGNKNWDGPKSASLGDESGEIGSHTFRRTDFHIVVAEGLQREERKVSVGRAESRKV